MKAREWLKEHEILIDFLLHIPWMVWATFLSIVERIGKRPKKTEGSRGN
ncbi:MAG: hypothetical protein PHR36_03480 [Patescibacteria group bacterium]|nr:hypothetical protein [Patescibacteria group bacterium]